MIRTAWQNDEGGILVFWAVCLVVILGIVGIGFDFGRSASTQSELQAYTDHVALAAAGELDGKTDAITRAQAAAANLITDTQTFGNGATTLAGTSSYTLDFYKTLPAADTSSISPGLTTNAALATYARVVVTPKTVPYTFTAVFDVMSGNAARSSTVGAVAVAGFTQYACDITPLMFCLPTPTYAADANIGKMIQLRSGGSGAAWAPGDFGFLDLSDTQTDPKGPCANLTGAKLIQCQIGSVGSITECFVKRGVDTEPGQKVGLENKAFNMRFDIYVGSVNNLSTDANYPAAPNVIKGIVPNGNGQSCIGNSPKASTNTVGLPRDDCFAAGTCTKFGTGVWSTGRANYVQKNYGGADPHASATSRYAYYLAEIASAGGGASSTPILAANRAERGRPICSTNQSADPDRRVVIAAGIDCTANQIKGSTTGIPVTEYFKLFLTEPVGDDPNVANAIDIWAEVVGSAEGSGGAGSSNGVIHDVVQLYR